MPTSSIPDYYELLGVAPDADATTVKRAYRRLARVVHPDTGGTPGMFRLLTVAYETLSDPERRQEYDADLDGTGVAPDTYEQDAEWPADQEDREDEDDGWAGEPAADDEGPEPATGGGPRHATVFDPTRLSWWNRARPGAAALVVPGTGRFLQVAGTLAFLAATGWLALASTWTARTVIVVVALLALDFAVQWYFRQYAAGRSGTAVLASGVSWIGFSLVLLGYLYVQGALRSLSLVPLAFSVGLLLVTAALAYRRGDRVWLDETVPMRLAVVREYGEPDVADGAEDDQIAEQTAADALSTLTALPGARMFRGVRGLVSPERTYVAVACGRAVALVEYHLWEPGGDTGIEEEVAAYAAWLGGSVEVRGFVLIAPSGGGPVTGAVGPDGLTVGDPFTVVERIGEWFTSRWDTDVVRRQVLVKLFEQIGSDDY